ncbi:hypothetical protein MBLNU13_g11666t1 [Cladosporium sp. NU13]
MPYAQPQQGCRDCQFCRNCDPTPGQSLQRPRKCRHNQAWTYIEPNTTAAANHLCPARTALAGRSMIAQRPQGQVAQYPQAYTTGSGYTYGNNPAGQYPNPQYGGYGYQPRSSYDDRHGSSAGERDLYENIEAREHARAHFGKNFATEPQNRRGTTYSGIVVGGNTVTHSGDNIGYPELETERLAKIPHLPKDKGRTDYRDRYNDQNDQ